MHDRLNSSFVKYIHVVGEKMARNGRKTDIRPVANFGNQALYRLCGICSCN
jgi:hypothetical protein